MSRSKSSATAPPSTRLQRGIRLFAERGAEITITPGGTYKVSSCTGDGFYVVYLDSDITTCSCPDHRRAVKDGERCKHVHAAYVAAAAKRRAARRRMAS